MLNAFIAIALLLGADLPNQLTPWTDVLRQHGFIGVVQVTVGQDTVFQYAQGIETSGQPTGSQSVFWIASISKQFAAAAVLRLVDTGTLDLDAPIKQYLDMGADALRLKGAECTVLQVLSHTCGLPQGSNQCPSLALDRAENRDRFLQCVANLELQFLPGTDYAYANVGIDLAGVLVTLVSGKKYDEFLHTEFFAPLGMTATGTKLSPALQTRLVHGQLMGIPSSWWLWLDPTGPGERGPSGNIYSTASDLHRWNQALHTGQLLSKQSYTRMITPVRESYGLGIAIKTNIDGRKAYWHNGALVPMNWSSHLAFIPDLNTSIVVLTPRNMKVSRMDDVGFGIIRGLLDEQAPQLAPLKASAYILDLIFLSLPLLIYACLGFAGLLIFRGPQKSATKWISSLVTTTGVVLVLINSLDIYQRHAIAMFLISLLPALALIIRRSQWRPMLPQICQDPKEQRHLWILLGLLLMLSWMLKADARLWLFSMVGIAGLSQLPFILRTIGSNPPHDS